jgi:iron complex outermembrane recepter protein
MLFFGDGIKHIMLKQKTLNRVIIIAFIVTAFCLQTYSSTAQRQLPTRELKKLSVEELMNIEVSSVSRRPERLSKTASAIQVITKEDMQLFGATRLPEALRLASNLEVAQVSSGEWSISARGFNSSTANKLLVLIDGRTVYSPLFAGVFWDIQDVLLDDVEQIEVISGPGGTLWGANAVNGVINIITKDSKSSRGLLLKLAGGNESKLIGTLRYGGAISKKLNFKIYGKYTDRDDAVLPDRKNAYDNWNLGQGGFRLDWDDELKNVVTLQGDLYISKIHTIQDDSLTRTKGGNILARWSHNFSSESDFKVQIYYDRVHRQTTHSFDDVLDTYDLDCQYRFLLGKRHDVVAGFGYRMIDDDFGPGNIMFVPQKRSLDIYSAFIQDEITLKKEKLYLVVGSKAQHNDYTGYEFQPGARLAWNISPMQQTLWAAVSRAVRTPSRIDRDFVAPPVLLGGTKFSSEVLWAYELGYRLQPHEKISASLATYFNNYDKIRSVEKVNDPAPFPLQISNGLYGYAYGAELTADYQIEPWWRMRIGYTYLNLTILPRSWSTDTSKGASEANDPQHMFSLRSTFDLPANFKLSPAFRYVSKIDLPMDVPAYGELDLNLLWQPNNMFDVSIVGQNLLHNSHAEFGNKPTAANLTSRREIERNVFVKVIWRY